MLEQQGESCKLYYGLDPGSNRCVSRIPGTNHYASEPIVDLLDNMKE